MMSYYNPASMYRHQQSLNPANGFQANSPMHPHSWYAQAYNQNAHMASTAPAAAAYCMQEEQQMWHPNHHHNVFSHEFPDFSAGIPALQQYQQQQLPPDPTNQIPSPPMTVSGSEMSSPGGSDNISPQNNNNISSPVQTRPPPARSPYEWIKKTSYQSQPNPGKTRTKDKYRVVYTDHQRIELEKEFTFNNKYITIRRKSELASTLGLSERQIKIWFQNRRAKERKQNKKRVEEKAKQEGKSTLAYHHHQPPTAQQQNGPQNLLGSQLAPNVVATMHQQLNEINRQQFQQQLTRLPSNHHTMSGAGITGYMKLESPDNEHSEQIMTLASEKGYNELENIKSQIHIESGI